MSFEDSAICESMFPSITAVHRDASLYGTKVANLLLKVLGGPWPAIVRSSPPN